MTLQTELALTALQDGARVRTSDPHTEERLADVQTFLASELVEVEELLAQAVSVGPEPGPSAAAHLVARGGKRVRPLSLLLAARCFPGGGDPSAQGALKELAAVVELVHSATLLHDDVVDEGMERRGAPCARRIHGNGVSVLAGDLLLVGALERTGQVAPQLLLGLISTLRRLVDGEIIQLRGRTELDLSEETYERVLSDKTASLFAFAASAGAQLAGASQAQQDALARFGEHLGIAFQLVDDVIDYEGEETGKRLFADLTEGKLTLPLVLALEQDADLEPLVQRIHEGDESVVAEVSDRVIATGACDETRARALDFTDRALAALRELPPSPARSLLEVVAREMTRRAA